MKKIQNFNQMFLIDKKSEPSRLMLSLNDVHSLEKRKKRLEALALISGLDLFNMRLSKRIKPLTFRISKLSIKHKKE